MQEFADQSEDTDQVTSLTSLGESARGILPHSIASSRLTVASASYDTPLFHFYT